MGNKSPKKETKKPKKDKGSHEKSSGCNGFPQKMGLPPNFARQKL